MLTLYKNFFCQVFFECQHKHPHGTKKKKLDKNIVFSILFNSRDISLHVRVRVRAATLTAHNRYTCVTSGTRPATSPPCANPPAPPRQTGRHITPVPLPRPKVRPYGTSTAPVGLQWPQPLRWCQPPNCPALVPKRHLPTQTAPRDGLYCHSGPTCTVLTIRATSVPGMAHTQTDKRLTFAMRPLWLLCALPGGHRGARRGGGGSKLFWHFGGIFEMPVSFGAF